MSGQQTGPTSTYHRLVERVEDLEAENLHLRADLAAARGYVEALVRLGEGIPGTPEPEVVAARAWLKAAGRK